MPALEQAQRQLTDFFTGLTGKQRFLLAGAAVLTLALLALFADLISSPDYKPLVTGMEPADAQALGAKLAARNIAYQISPDGKSVSVASAKLDSSRMELASEGMPRSGRLGFELFDKLNWGATEFDEKVNYQRALEGELERSIQTLKDVESVRVHLVMPTDSVFLDRERAAKASVVLRPRNGHLSDDTQQSIARLVAGAVDNLSPENVTVVDADTNRPLGGSKQDSSSSSAEVQQELTTRLLRTLDPVVGADHVRASVNVEFDPTTRDLSEETYDPKSAVSVASQRSEEQVGGGLSGGVPGTSSNVPAPSNPSSVNTKTSTGSTSSATNAVSASSNAPGANASGANTAGVTKTPFQGGDETQISRSESNTYVVSKLVRHTMEPPGRVRRISAALLVDDAIDVKQEGGKRTETRRKRTPDELKQIDDLAMAAIGIDPARGDSLTIENLAFEQPAAEPPVKPSVSERVLVTLNDWSSILRYAALILLFLLAYLLLLRPMKKQLLTTFRELPSHLAAHNAQITKAAGTELGPGQDLAALPAEQQRAIVLKKQLTDKVKGEPAAASQLIQAWLREGGR
ncbi:MAG TPA: flagellar basal-body MS-ring/collar protein FliF [Terriglobales bacterium]|nr:flagellar basal-body MS-ring/collar protein FliF [Terriglobales bacterium]